MRGATVDGEAGGLLELSSPSASSLCLQCAPGYEGQNCSKEQDACQSQPVPTTEPAPPGLEASTVPALQDLWGCAVRGMWMSVSTDPATPRALQSATL